MACSRYRRGRFTVSESVVAASDADSGSHGPAAPEQLPRSGSRRGSTEHNGKVYKRGRFTVSCFTACVQGASASDEDDCLAKAACQALPTEPSLSSATGSGCTAASPEPRLASAPPLVGPGVNAVTDQVDPSSKGMHWHAAPALKAPCDTVISLDQRGYPAAAGSGQQRYSSPASWTSADSEPLSHASSFSHHHPMSAASHPPHAVRICGPALAAPQALQPARAAPPPSPPPSPPVLLRRSHTAPLDCYGCTRSLADAPRSIMRTYQRGRFQVEEALLHPHHTVVPGVCRGSGGGAAALGAHALSSDASAVAARWGRAEATGEQEAFLKQRSNSSSCADRVSVKRRTTSFFRRGRFLVQQTFHL